jgi:hypothetical protein
MQRFLIFLLEWGHFVKKSEYEEIKSILISSGREEELARQKQQWNEAYYRGDVSATFHLFEQNGL